jgi:hypothetical protein
LPNGNVLIAGGIGAGGSALAGAELYMTEFGADFTRPVGPLTLTRPAPQASGGFQLGFTSVSDVLFRVLASTDPTLPLSQWSVLGYPTETTPGQYVFTDSQSANYPARFYRVTYP